MVQTQYTHDTDVILDTQTLAKEPPLYVIIMHNDDFTTMDFVVAVLVEVFDYGIQKAVDTMMQVHHEGYAPVAVFPKEIAEMKIAIVEEMAEQAQFPLLLTLQKA
ncbi:MAG: ATP-dependent Clp protease adaptor ClpS [Moraxella sp.]|nr:ATP-dependent Clp protease adaptor ClpS [Moraxella sp.]